MALIDPIPDTYDRQLDILNRLLDEAIGRHALFFEIDAGTMPDGSPEITGYALDAVGQAYWFTLGWDAERRGPLLTTLKPVSLEPRWQGDAEYLDARRVVGVGTPASMA